MRFDNQVKLNGPTATIPRFAKSAAQKTPRGSGKDPAGGRTKKARHKAGRNRVWFFTFVDSLSHKKVFLSIFIYNLLYVLLLTCCYAMHIIM